MRPRVRWLLAAACALVLLVAAGRPWLTSTAPDPVLGTSRLEVTGGQVSPVLVAVAVLALACVLAALLGSRALRLIAGAGLMVAGALALGSTLVVMLDPVPAVEAALSARTARTGASGQVSQAQPTLWPWVGGAVAAAMVVLAILGLATSGTPAVERAVSAGDRARPAGQAAATQADRAPDAAPGHDAWDRLSRGEDPTDRW